MPIMAKSNDEYTEVKAIKTPDGTEIDYVLSKVDNTYKRTYTATRELEDTPPLEFKSIKPNANLIDYRIYGQTVDGESVGDRTGNLFDGTFIHRSVIELEVCADDPNRRSVVVDISNFNNGDKITFSRETSAGDRFQMYQVSSPLEGGELFPDSVISGNSETLLATITFDNISKYPYLMIFLNGAAQHITDEELLASKIMINVGNTPLPYEPYGYKVPVTVEGKNLFNFDEPNVKGYDFEKQSEGVYYIADTGHLYGANRYKLDTETGKQYVFKGVVDNTNISTQLSGYLEGTENPVEGQIFKTGNINIIFTANGKTTLTIFGYKAHQSGTVTNLQVYDISITDDTYEPYHAPITTPIYLPEPLKMVGGEAEHIDYGQQKVHRVRKNLFNGYKTTDIIDNSYIDRAVGNIISDHTYYISYPIAVIANQNYVWTFNSSRDGDLWKHSAPTVGFYDVNDVLISTAWHDDNINSFMFTVPANCSYIRASVYKLILVNKTEAMLNIGSEPLPYEPYIKNTDLDVTLPALPTVTGTNVLSVGTEVQPSDMYIKGNFKMIAGGGE